MYTIIVGLLFFISGGASVAAEYSLPGDLLYPVKVHVTEEVRSVLMFSDESKAGWELERANRREEERTTLETEGRLNAETEAALEAQIEVHTTAAESFTSPNDTVTEPPSETEDPIEIEEVEEDTPVWSDEPDVSDGDPGNGNGDDVPTDTWPSISLYRTYADGAHRFTGVIEVNTPCHSLEVDLRIAELYPEMIYLDFTIEEPQLDSGIACPQVTAFKPFDISAVASAAAQVSVFINGEQVAPSIKDGVYDGEMPL